MRHFLGIFFSRYILAAIVAWAVAQLLKVILTLCMTKRFDSSRVFGSGGMPSSHSSMSVALLTTIGLRVGFDSAVFAVAFCFACVVMYDAAGVRRSTGKNAATLNQLMDLLSGQGYVSDEERLKELVGHTPLQVAAGAVLGIVIGYLFGTVNVAA
ncbi:MAG: divergent PAP2 family protein [Clostridia bacterium]|nr:divergent PAP2 family protein [Clostridia bacterium]